MQTRIVQINNTKNYPKSLCTRHRLAFIEDSAPQKITAKIIKHEIFCGTGFYKRRKKNCKEKKEELPSAIGKNYINKNVSFLLTFYL